MARRVAAQSERQARPRRHRRRLVAGDDGMKPHGPIPPGFAADAGGMLLIGGRRADALAGAGEDTPLFVYDSVMLAARVAAWRAAMPAAVQLHYAMKANPFARSEEHTSELQSLMRISYAVFCLKKKKTKLTSNL